MPTYRVTGPDGKVYRVTPPAGTNPTPDEVLARVRAEVERGTPAAAPSGPEDTPSFLRRLGQGYETGAQWLTKKLAKGIETAADTGLSPVSLGPFSEKVAETVVPQTPLQAGVMLGTAPAGAVGAPAEGGGVARIGAAKESVIAEIEQALQAVPGQVSQNVAGRPAMVRGATPGQWGPGRQQGEIAVPALGEPSITLRDANARPSEIGDMMRGIKPLDPRFP